MLPRRIQSAALISWAFAFPCTAFPAKKMLVGGGDVLSLMRGAVLVAHTTPRSTCGSSATSATSAGLRYPPLSTSAHSRWPSGSHPACPATVWRCKEEKDRCSESDSSSMTERFRERFRAIPPEKRDANQAFSIRVWGSLNYLGRSFVGYHLVV